MQQQSLCSSFSLQNDTKGRQVMKKLEKSIKGTDKKKILPKILDEILGKTSGSSVISIIQ